MYGGNNGSLSEGVEDNTVKDSNIYLWLLQKLGPLGMEWTSNSVVTHINEEILSKIRESFTMFNEDLKIKILLTFLHMSRRSLTEHSDVLDEIIELGRGDLDNRVAMISEIMKPYPETGILKFEAPEAERFQKLLTEFTQDFENESNERTLTARNVDKLPMEYPYLNPNVLESELQDEIKTRGSEPLRHFILKKPHKSVALKIEILERAKKASLIDNQRALSMQFPLRKRGMPLKLESKGDDQNRWNSEQEQAAKDLSQFRTNVVVKRNAGPILLDITEQPNPFNTKKKSIATKITNKKVKQSAEVEAVTKTDEVKAVFKSCESSSEQQTLAGQRLQFYSTHPEVHEVTLEDQIFGKTCCASEDEKELIKQYVAGTHVGKKLSFSGMSSNVTSLHIVLDRVYGEENGLKYLNYNRCFSMNLTTGTWKVIKSFSRTNHTEELLSSDQFELLYPK